MIHIHTYTAIGGMVDYVPTKFDGYWETGPVITKVTLMCGKCGKVKTVKVSDGHQDLDFVNKWLRIKGLGRLEESDFEVSKSSLWRG